MNTYTIYIVHWCIDVLWYRCVMCTSRATNETYFYKYWNQQQTSNKPTKTPYTTKIKINKLRKKCTKNMTHPLAYKFYVVYTVLFVAATTAAAPAAIETAVVGTYGFHIHTSHTTCAHR